MVKKTIHKVSGGKLLRIKAEINNSVIREIKITGDFFIHPENDLMKIEEILQGKQIDQAKQAVDEFTEKNQTQIIGFTSADLQEALKKLSS
ncbi:MAG: lipoate protein ligase C-terminal domain-containing protein [Candidatus Moranbacteria bacterium]|nr:lipoate protein ligase C-terminal domain-containing protein [Candidatus Moranbacteria bacterium]